MAPTGGLGVGGRPGAPADWAKGGPCTQHLSLSIRAAPPSPEALLFPSGLGGDGRGRPRLPQAPGPSPQDRGPSQEPGGCALPAPGPPRRPPRCGPGTCVPCSQRPAVCQGGKWLRTTHPGRGRASVQGGAGMARVARLAGLTPTSSWGTPLCPGWLSHLHVTEPRPGMNLKDKGPAERPQVRAGQVGGPGAGAPGGLRRRGAGSRGGQGLLDTCRWPGLESPPFPAHPLLTHFLDSQSQGGCGPQQHPAEP